MNGKIISIEGTDGSGKHTQQQLLAKHLKELGYKIFEQSFPNYESDSAAPVKMYLSGKFGSDPNCLDPYQASALYAVDRLCTYQISIKPHYENGEIILFDRYVQSNLIHQSSKFSEQKQKDEFLNYIYELEFERFKLPKPDLVFFIEMPVEKSLELAKSRESYKNGEKKDILEEDAKYMEKSYNTGVELAKKLNWTIIHAVDDFGNIKTIDEIHKEITDKVLDFLEKTQN